MKLCLDELIGLDVHELALRDDQDGSLLGHSLELGSFLSSLSGRLSLLAGLDGGASLADALEGLGRVDQNQYMRSTRTIVDHLQQE